jgi:DNA (cytosine-5)-methyltransferase 1
LAANDAGLGAESVLACDLDPAALAVYARNLVAPLTLIGSVADHIDYVVKGAGDSAKFGKAPKIVGPVLGNFAGGIDLLLAGPPCQGHSALNNHTRHDDPRNGLYLAVPAIAAALGIPNVVKTCLVLSEIEMALSLLLQHFSAAKATRLRWAS